MLQAIFTNVRTISLAFVMVTMLMVGVMTPVQQVAAQEVSVEQRAVMIEQIKQLMQLIGTLQEKLLVQERKKYESVHQETTNVIHGNSYVEVTKRVTLTKTPDSKNSVGRQAKGDRGDVIAGPKLINGEVWWKVEFENREGWINEDSLVRIPSVTINSDLDGDGVKERVARILGDYKAERFILFPADGEVMSIYIEKDMEMIGTNQDTYVSGQVSEAVNGSPRVLLSDPYSSAKPFVKGKSLAVPIAWRADNVPMNSEVEVQIEAVRLVDSPLSGGTWKGEALTGTSAGRYFWSIEGEGRIGAGDYRIQIRIVNCTNNLDCRVLATSQYEYFTIVN